LNHFNRGRFKLHRRFLLDDPDNALRVFEQLHFVPIQTHSDPYYDMLIYSGISGAFREIREGEVMPWYELTVEKDPETGDANLINVEELPDA